MFLLKRELLKKKFKCNFQHMIEIKRKIAHRFQTCQKSRITYMIVRNKYQT